MNPSYRFPDKWIDRVYFAVLAVTVALCVFGSGMTYGMKLQGVWSSAVCLPVGLVLLALMALGTSRCTGSSARKRRMLCLTIGAGAVLYFIASQTAVFCPWDGEAVYTGSRDLAAGEGSALLNDYLSVYPNNRMITFL